MDNGGSTVYIVVPILIYIALFSTSGKGGTHNYVALFELLVLVLVLLLLLLLVVGVVLVLLGAGADAAGGGGGVGDVGCKLFQEFYYAMAPTSNGIISRERYEVSTLPLYQG